MHPKEREDHGGLSCYIDKLILMQSCPEPVHVWHVFDMDAGIYCACASEETKLMQEQYLLNYEGFEFLSYFKLF